MVQLIMIGPTTYLNGQYLPIDEAKISPLDRGFLFGDGVYEVIPVYSRHPFRLDEHLARLQHSLDGIRLANPLPAGEWHKVVSRLIATAPWEDIGIYLQITRGPDTRRDHPFPARVTPTVFAMTSPLLTPSAEVRDRGVSAITAADNRWLRCDLKAIALLANVLLRQQSVDVSCAETILLRDGLVTEGTTSNILIVHQGTLIAPPKSHLILPGVTCDIVLELAHQHALPCTIRPIAEAELRDASEIWLTSSTKEILAVTRLDNQAVGDGHPGPVGKAMWQWYQEFKTTVMRHG